MPSRKFHYELPSVESSNKTIGTYIPISQELDQNFVEEMATSENKARALRGELYYAFTPELVQARRRASQACSRYNNAGEVTRRRQVELWRE